jgi:2-succinyl-6-hydroxy-2,4-cyclohexadiene-1-carboxylate synthase
VTTGYLHGFLGSPEVWDGIAADGGIRVALPGHHGGPPMRRTWDDNIEEVAHALGAVDLVVGYSLGARVALGLVASGNVPRAILISVNPGIDHADRHTRRAQDTRWAKRFRTEPLAEVLDAWEAQSLFATQANVPDDVLAARRARRLAHDPEQLARSLEAMGLAEMPNFRYDIDGRFTLIAGARDTKYVDIARSLPVPLTVIDDCGHDPTLEKPAELARVLRELGA